eukprot:299178-Pelagomonas_calceolata.AAC.3
MDSLNSVKGAFRLRRDICTTGHVRGGFCIPARSCLLAPYPFRTTITGHPRGGATSVMGYLPNRYF